MDPLDEPPPYTPRAATNAGETTIEQGPRRPFQPAPAPASTLHHPQPGVGSSNTGSSGIGSSSTGGGGTNPFRALSPGRPSAGTLLHQLSTSFNNAVNSLASPSPQPRHQRSVSATPTGGSWSSYPGGRSPQQQPQYAAPSHPPPSSTGGTLPPPPRHPSSSAPHLPSAASSPVSNPSSDFARDFYAAGASYVNPDSDEDDTPQPPGAYAPPPGPPPQQSPPPPPPRPAPSEPAVPNDGRPTARPVVGHPLLNEGRILVYPKRYECDKCHNTGYKSSDPARPCKRCWSKHARPFSGPLAYSFRSSDSSHDDNFQRPLTSLPVPMRRAPSFSGPQFLAPSPSLSPHHTGSYSRGGLTSFTPSPPLNNNFWPTLERPPPGALVYQAGDPRLGGALCWRCGGKGNVSFLLGLDRISCEVCGGVGRVFT